MTGCKNNRYELDKIQEWAVSNGIKIVDENEADFSIINTCTVTHIADKKSRQLIRKTKNSNPKLKTIVFGCAARMQKKEFEKIEEIDHLLPDLKTVLGFLGDVNNTTIQPKAGFANPAFGNRDVGRSRALVQIQDGCDNYCSYCIIAAARGRSKSRPADEIIEEVKQHVKNGYNEVVLTGINIGAYGCSVTTKPEESKLAELLNNILEKTNIKRVRLSSMGSEYFFNYELGIRNYELNGNLINILKNPRICRHIHLSVQSGSDSVLKRMKRNYSVRQMDDIIYRLKEDIPGIAITADIIVGFPEEMDEEFAETVDFVKRHKLAKVHVFPYSIRKNTLAATRPQVSDEVKKERAHKLQKIANKLRSEFIKNQTGKSVSVLWESESDGLTDNYIRIHKKGSYKVCSVTIEKLEKQMVLCKTSDEV
jgi:threonylcarbamoyladenosine tRNA methylthiotransferase MtaB